MSKIIKVPTIIFFLIIVFNITTVLGTDIMLNSTLSEINISMKKFNEYEIGLEQQKPIRELLNAAFPGYFPTLTFYKQLPTMRILAYSDMRLIGQVGIVHRVVSISKRTMHIFGVSDLCVREDYRCKGIGRALLEFVDALATEHNISHIFAFADDPRLYTKLGYVTHSNVICRFLAIDEFQSHSIVQREEPTLLIKSSEELVLANQTIDLLGYLF